ncbi:MAG TPA: hypothetical protein ENN30_00570 [Candidatus Woesearchaeota archaeon]|nr:hypothetical protein [Candidatus Woesearchaeota archaeon]
MANQKVLHYPRLDTVMMVEKTLKKMDIHPTKMQLWKALPKSMQYQTFLVILEYLEESGKIMILKDGKIIWTHNPKLMANTVSAKNS